MAKQATPPPGAATSPEVTTPTGNIATDSNLRPAGVPNPPGNLTTTSMTAVADDGGFDPVLLIDKTANDGNAWRYVRLTPFDIRVGDAVSTFRPTDEAGKPRTDFIGIFTDHWLLAAIDEYPVVTGKNSQTPPVAPASS